MWLPETDPLAGFPLLVSTELVTLVVREKSVREIFRLYSPARQSAPACAMQDECRKQTRASAYRGFFNICVNKRVENSGSSKANYTVLSMLERFAQFRCSLSTNTFAAE